MGNKCATPKPKKIQGNGKSVQQSPNRHPEAEIMKEFYGTELHFLPYNERRAQLEEWLQDIQKHNLERLRKEMITDLHGFILNNILLCLQFYQNFDSAMSAAKEFKQTTETRMAKQLTSMTFDGVILGQRKCFLIHGMGHLLAQNYVYKDDGHAQKKKLEKTNEVQRKTVTIAPTIEKVMDEPRSTFTCDSILPLEFIITWENLEVYKESEWDGLKESEYASPTTKGSVTIRRVCLEETDEKNRIPKGFARLRVVDTPPSFQPFLPIPTIPKDHVSSSPSESVGYAAYAYSTAEEAEEEFHDKVDDHLDTDSDFSATTTESEDAGNSDYSAAFRTGTDFMSSLKTHIQTSSPITKTTLRSSMKTVSTIPDNTIQEEPKTEPAKVFTVTLPAITGSGNRTGRTFSSVKSEKYENVIQELSQQKNMQLVTVSPHSPAAAKLTGRTFSSVKSEKHENVIQELSQRKNIPLVTVSSHSPAAADVSNFSGKFKHLRRDTLTPKLNELSLQFENNVLKSRSRNGELLSPSSALQLRRKSKSLPTVAPPKPPPPPPQLQGLPTSSKPIQTQLHTAGFESISQEVLQNVRSRSSSNSINSDDVHHKWRQVELKRLWQFVPKRRQNAKEPLSDTCYQKIQLEVETDDEGPEFEADESETDSSSTDDSSSVTSSANHEKKRTDPTEPTYEDRTYLNSMGFSADFCSEFKQIGTELGIEEGPLRSAVVLGTTVRCAVPQSTDTFDEKPKFKTTNLQSSNRVKKNRTQDSITTLYTFTPSLQSKNWPQKPLIWWKGKMIREVWDGTEKWPTREQVEEIEEAGCNVIPLGSRSIHSTQSENVQQTLVWNVGFAAAENVLLNSLLHVQWRTFTFSSLIFRAFIAPLGPLGIGLDHFRNILYFMCHEEFLSWNYEQPGLHVKTLLDKLYDCLGRGDMPSFFISGQNLLKNIPAQNLRKVQAYLSRVRNNLLFHSIYMIRNLVQVNTDFYPLPKDNFRKLYDYLTVSEKHILYLVNPLLAGITTEDLKLEASEKKRKKMEKKKINQALLMNGELIDSAYDNVLNKEIPKFRQVDHEQKKLRRKRERWNEKQQIIKDKEAREARIAAENAKLPQDKRNSIDLEEMPLKQRQFSAQRLGLVLKYFIKHFIKMSAKSYEFKAFAQSSMYAQHVENLISILSELPNEADSQEMDKFKEDSSLLRETIGAHMVDYIQEKMAYTGQTTGETTKTFDLITGLLNNSRKVEAFGGSWDLQTIPHPPPIQETRSIKIQQSSTPNPNRINFNGSNVARSLASLSVSSYNPNDGGSSGDYHIPRIGGNLRRSVGIKWNSNPVLPPAPNSYVSRVRSEFYGDNVTFGYASDQP